MTAPQDVVATAQNLYFPQTMLGKGQLQAVIESGGESQFNFATPAAMLELLDSLYDYADAIQKSIDGEELRSNLESSGLMGFLPLANPLTDKEARQWGEWRDRLDFYMDLANEAPLDDKIAIFPDLTLPLLIGLYPGEDQSRIPDIATPFEFATRMGYAKAIGEYNVGMFWHDVGQNTADIIEGAADIVVAAGQAVKKLPAAAGAAFDFAKWALRAVVALGVVVLGLELTRGAKRGTARARERYRL